MTHDEFMQSLAQMQRLRQQKDDLAQEVKDLNAKIKELNYQLADYFMNNDIQNINANGSLFYLASKTSPNVKDADALKEWLAERDMLDAMMMFNTRGFKAYYKELAENNQELPPMVEMYVEQEVRMKKGA